MEKKLVVDTTSLISHNTKLQPHRKYPILFKMTEDTNLRIFCTTRTKDKN